MPNRLGKIESLQIGRGIAALLVVLHHVTGLVAINTGATFAGGYFHGGSAGVDFFFVLSGFIIYYRHAREFGKPDKLTGYAWRRLVRVFPIYWIVLLAAVAVAFAVPGYGGADVRDPAMLASSFLLLPVNPGPILFVGWTLTHELWFYLIFALLIASKGRWLQVLIAFWTAAMVVMLCVPEPGRIFTNAWFRVAFLPLNLEFVMGCVAAWLVRRQWDLPIFTWRMLVVVGAAGFAALTISSGSLPADNLRVRVFGFGLCAFLLVLGMAGDKLHGNATGEGSKGPLHIWLVFFGDASYSLYLIHTLALSMTWKVGEITGVLPKLGPQVMGWICVGASIVAACLFHSWAEKPLIKKIGSLRRNV